MINRVLNYCFSNKQIFYLVLVFTDFISNFFSRGELCFNLGKNKEKLNF